jgi:ABC-type lipoprotein export system ATPase subunit
MSTPAPDGPGSGLDAHCVNVVHLYPSAGGDVVALRGVDLDVGGGELVALLGPSGSGKSTVLGLLAGLLRPSAGEVLVGGHRLPRLAPRELARMRATELALVPQQATRSLLPYADAEQNVWWSQQGARGRGVTPRFSPPELLDLLGLSGLGRRPVGVLSGGEQQRVALAAGLACGPGLLLVDEPTSQLDAAARDEVIALLVRINAEFGTTVLAVTHDDEVAAAVPRTVTIRDGRVGAEGHRGQDYAVVGRDGAVQLPPDVLDVLPPGTLVRLRRSEDGVELRAAGPDELGDTGAGP